MSAGVAKLRAIASSREAIPHLVLRIPFIIRIGDKSVDVVEAHNQVLAKSGRVGVAKFGRALSVTRISLFRDGLGKASRSDLLLVGRGSEGFECWRARIEDVIVGGSAGTPTPEYYDEVDRPVAALFVIKSAFKRSSLDGLRTAYGKRPLKEVLSECRTAFIFAEGHN